MNFNDEAKKIIKEAYVTTTYGDSLEDQSYVIASLCLGLVKRTVVDFCFISDFNEEVLPKAIKLGVDLLKGETKPETYYSQFKDLCLELLSKDKRKGIIFDDFLKTQIINRLIFSFNTAGKKNALRENVALPSGKQVGDQLSLDFGVSGKLTHCRIAAVKFTEDKVFYNIDVAIQLEGQEVTDVVTIFNVDSIIVSGELGTDTEEFQEAIKKIKSSKENKALIKEALKIKPHFKLKATSKDFNPETKMLAYEEEMARGKIQVIKPLRVEDIHGNMVDLYKGTWMKEERSLATGNSYLSMGPVTIDAKNIPEGFLNKSQNKV